MKVLLVSESDNILNSYNSFFIENGYDTICYNWLLKALDNVEEICPHIVLINSIDYPRHWKILVQYIHSNVNLSVSAIILVITKNFDEKERKKAKILDVHCVCDGLSIQEIADQLLALLELKQSLPLSSNEKTKSDSFAMDKSIPTKEHFIEPTIERTIEHLIEPTMQTDLTNTANIDDIVKNSAGACFTFNHPRTQARITGIVEHYNHPVLFFKPSNTAYSETIRFGKKIEGATLTVADVDSLITVQVQGREDGIIEFCIIKQIVQNIV